MLHDVLNAHLEDLVLVATNSLNEALDAVKVQVSACKRFSQSALCLHTFAHLMHANVTTTSMRLKH